MSANPFIGVTLGDAKRILVNRLRDAGFDMLQDDVRDLLMAVMRFDPVELISQSQQILNADETAQLHAFLQRRLSGEPVDNILGEREFYGRMFKTGRSVLSPRGDTEVLVRAGLDVLRGRAAPRFLDLGTGSGAIAVTLLAECPAALGTATDLSEAALSMARDNAKRHGVDDRLAFLQGDWFEPVAEEFDLIISNPPYITDEAMAELSPDVSGFDPQLALRGGPDGLDAYRKIFEKARQFLKPDGWLIVEIGYDQGDTVPALLTELGYSGVSVEKDLSGHDRVVKACTF